MKSIIFASLLFSMSAMAMDPLCTTKQKNAASFALAQEAGVAVQNVTVVSFQNGMWTEAVGMNSGTDTVTVKAPNRVLRNILFRTYEVAAKQIGATEDCTIVKVSPVK